jgi:hypothetical protein
MAAWLLRWQDANRKLRWPPDASRREIFSGRRSSLPQCKSRAHGRGHAVRREAARRRGRCAAGGAWVKTSMKWRPLSPHPNRPQPWRARLRRDVCLVVQVGLQDSPIVLAAVEHADDGYHFGVHVECDHGPFFVVRDAQAGAYVIAADTSTWEGLQPLAICNDCTGIALRNLW